MAADDSNIPSIEEKEIKTIQDIHPSAHIVEFLDSEIGPHDIIFLPLDENGNVVEKFAPVFNFYLNNINVSKLYKTFICVHGAWALADMSECLFSTHGFQSQKENIIKYLKENLNNLEIEPSCFLFNIDAYNASVIDEKDKLVEGKDYDAPYTASFFEDNLIYDCDGKPHLIFDQSTYHAFKSLNFDQKETFPVLLLCTNGQRISQIKEKEDIESGNFLSEMILPSPDTEEYSFDKKVFNALCTLVFNRDIVHLKFNLDPPGYILEKEGNNPMIALHLKKNEILPKIFDELFVFVNGPRSPFFATNDESDSVRISMIVLESFAKEKGSLESIGNKLYASNFREFEQRGRTETKTLEDGTLQNIIVLKKTILDKIIGCVNQYNI